MKSIITALFTASVGKSLGTALLTAYAIYFAVTLARAHSTQELSNLCVAKTEAAQKSTIEPDHSKLQAEAEQACQAMSRIAH